MLILFNFFCCNLFPFCLLNMFFNRPWFIYNTQWCWTFPWMHLAVGYWCHTLLVLSNRLVFGSSCEGFFISCFFISVFPLHTAYHHLFWWRCIFAFLFMLILYDLQLIPIWLVPCILLSANGSFPPRSEFVSVLSFCQGLQKLWWDIFMLLLLLFLRNFYWYFAVYWYPYFDVVSNITFFCWVEALLWYIIHIIIHAIKDGVGIPNCGTLCMSECCSFNGIIFSVRFCCTDYPPLDLWKVHFEDELIDSWL